MALDDATRTLVEQFEAAGRTPLHRSTPEVAREEGRAVIALYGPGPDMEHAEDHRVASADGTTFTVRSLVPRGAPRGTIVYYHGGGWTLGGLEEFDTLGRVIADRTGCTVLLPDYRLAPEHPFPAGLEDAWATVEWAAERREELSAGASPLIVAGDSAGGNLAAVVSRWSRDIGGPDIALQILVYPVTDCDFDTPSYRDPACQVIVRRESMQWFWDFYAPDVDGRTDPALSPLRAPDLAGLPPAVVLTAAHDPLRDEGEAYARRLEAAGVPVVLRRFEGQMHGFFTLVNVLPGSAAGIDHVVHQVERQLSVVDA